MAEENILRYVREDNGQTYEFPESRREEFLQIAKENNIGVSELKDPLPKANPETPDYAPADVAPFYRPNAQPDNLVEKNPTYGSEAKLQVNPVQRQAQAEEPVTEENRAKPEDFPLANPKVQEIYNKANQKAADEIGDIPIISDPMAERQRREEFLASQMEKAGQMYTKEDVRKAADQFEEQAELNYFNNYINSEFSEDDLSTHSYVEDMLAANAADGLRDKMEGITPEQYSTYLKIEQSDKEFFNSPIVKRVVQRETDRAKKNLSDISAKKRAYMDEKGATRELVGQEGKVTAFFDNPDDIPEYNALDHAERLARQSLQQWQAGSRYDRDFFSPVKQYAKGHVDRMSDRDWWGAVGGFTELRRNNRVRDIGEKLERAAWAGEEDPTKVLTDGELELLKQYYYNAETNAARSRDMSRAYKSGQVSADALPFMVDFLLTDGATTAVKEAVAKALGNKFLGKSIGGFVGAAARTAMMPTSYTNASRQLLERNPDGSFKYDKGKAWAVGMLDSAIETLSESFGAGLEKWGLGKMIGNKLSGSKVGSTIYDILHSTNDVLRMGGFNGLAGEWVEELYGTLLRMTLPEYYGNSKEQWSDFWSADNQATMLGGFAAMSALGAFSNINNRIKTEKGYKDELRKIRAEQEKYRGGLYDTLSGLGISDDKINKLVKGLSNKTIEEAGNEFDGLLAETRKSYKGKEYGKYVQMRRQAREDYENLVRATAEQGLVEDAKKEAVEAARGEIDKEDMLFDWDAIAERRQQRREERAERGPVSDYMQPIVPADMVAPSANEPVAPVQEPQTQQPAQQEPEKPDLVKMFKDRHNGAALPVDAEGNVTPVMKDGKVVGYMKGSTNRGITGNKVITFLEQGKDDRWSTRTVSESQGYTLGKPITADEAYNTVLAPVMLAQQEAANAQQAVVSSDAQDTAQTIDAAQADVAANIDAQNEAAAKAVDSAEQSLDEAQKNLEGAAPQNTDNQQEGQTPPPANDEEAFMASLPRKGKGKELDYAAFTPEQTVRYTAMQSDLATAIEDARATVAQRQQEIAELNDKIGKAVGTDRLALRAQAKALADEIAAYESIINEYQDTVGASAPAEQPAAAEPVAAPQPAPAPKTTSRRQSRKPAEKPAEAAAPVAPAAPAENKAEEPKAAPKPKAEPAPKKEKKAAPVETPKDEPVAGMPKKYVSIKKELAAAQNKKEEKEPKRKLATFLRKATDEELIAVLEDVRNMVSNGEKMNGLNSLIYQLERELEKRNADTSDAISNLQTEIASLSGNTSSEATAEQAAEAPKEEKKETRKRKSEKKETTATEPAAEQTEAETEEPVEEVSIAGEVSGMLDRLEAAYTEDAEAGNTDTSKAAYAEIRERVNQATSANELQAISAQLQDEGDGLMVEDSKGNRASTNDERTHAINSLKDMVERRRSYITNGYGKKMRKSDGSLTKIGKKVQREATRKRKSEQAKRDAEGAAANKAAAQEALASVKANAETRAQAEQAKKDEKANARKRVEQGMAVKKSTEEPAAESAVEKVTKPARQRALEALDAAANLEIDSDEAYNTALKLKRDIDSLAKRGVDKKERGTGITNDIKARLKDASEKLSSDLNLYKNSQGRSLDEILDEENKEHAEATRWRTNEEQVEDLKKQLEAKRVELDKLERIKSLGDRVDDGDAIDEGVEASSKVDDDIEATRQEIRNIKGKIRKLGGEYRTNAEIVADDIKAKEKEIVDINREIGKIPAAKRVSEALAAQDELKRRADNGDEDAAKAYSTNIKIINNANNRAFYDELAGLYKRLFPNASTTDQAFRDWLDSRYEELSDERSDINSQIMRLHDEARKEISGGEGRKATLKEIGRLTNQLMKFLPASMRSKIRVLSHEEFMKQLQKSDGARQQMAYHGSGALFDHFDHAFMSTGEGAQAYGWGTYVSGNRDISKSYAEKARRAPVLDVTSMTEDERREYDNLKNNVDRLRKKADRAISEYQQSDDGVFGEDGVFDRLVDEFLSAKGYSGERRDSFRQWIMYRTRKDGGKYDYDFESIQKEIDDLKSQRSLSLDGRELESIDATLDFWQDIMVFCSGELGQKLLGYLNENQQLHSLMTSAETEFYAAAEKLENFCKPFYTTEYAYLYDVEIPDDTGNNYLGWEKGVSSEDIRAAMMILEGHGYDVPNDFGTDVYTGDDLLNAIERVVFEDEAFEAAFISGVRIIPGRYGPIASQMLSEMGYVGISVPTNYTNSHRNEAVRNYVIFKESDAKITGYVRFQNDTGETLGFVDRDGSCYIDADNAHVDTPLHEIGIHMLMDAAKQTGEAGLSNAIIEYGKQAPQEFVDHVKNNYGYLWNTMESCRAAVEAEDTVENRKRLEDAEAAFYEEVAAHAFGKAFEDRQAEFAQQNIFQRLLNAIKEFLDRLFNGKYANLDVFDSVEKMGADEIGQKLYDLVMGGREIANANERSDAVSGNSSVGELSEDRRERLSHSPLALPLDIAKVQEKTYDTKNRLAKVIRAGHTILTSGDANGVVRGIGKAAGFDKSSSSQSYYSDIITDNGQAVRIRVSTHPANGERFNNSPTENNISIVVYKNGAHINDGPFEEYTYRLDTLDAQSIADTVVAGIDNLIRTGEYVDSSNTAEYHDYHPQPRIRRQIIGEKGATAIDELHGNSEIMSNLERAKEMWRNGDSKRSILASTGWQFGADGKWRYEIMDVVFSDKMDDFLDSVKITDKGIEFGDGEGTLPFKKGDFSPLPNERLQTTLGKALGDTEESRMLFAAYPNLRNMPLWLYAEEGDQTGGTVFDEKGKAKRIELNLTEGRRSGILGVLLRDNNDIRSTLLHEIQHAIQGEEGFQRGTNIWKVIDQYPELQKEHEELLEEYEALKPDLDRFNELDAKDKVDVLNLEETNEWLALRDKLDEYDYKTDEFYDKCYDYYSRTYGEVEARNVSARMGMTAEERRQSLFEDTYDEDARKGILIPQEAVQAKEEEIAQEVAKQSATTTSAAEEALLAMDGAPARQTAAEWRQWFKDKKIKDKDLMYFLGEGGRRADDEGIDAFDIADYIDHRYRNDNPYSVALRDVAEHGWGRADSKIGKALHLKDGWAMDALRYLKDAVRAFGAIKENVALYGGNLDSENDFEHLHNTQQSKAGRTIQRFENDIFAPLVEAAAALGKKLGVDREMIGNYITALHAPERNKFVTCRKVADEVNEWAAGKGIDIELSADDVMPFYDGNLTAGMDAKVADKIKDVLATKYGTEEARVQSGMTDSEAQQLVNYFENLVNSKGATDELNNMMDNLRLAIAETTTFALDHGLITPEQYDEYTNRYEHYVPLLGFEDEADREAAFDNYRPENRTSTGNVNPNIRRTAQGRKSMSVDPIAGILVRGINTINNGYENDSRMALHKMIMDNPDMKELFYVGGMETPEWAKELSRKGELDDHAVFVYVNGVPTKMYFNGSQGRVLSNGLDNYDTVTRKISRMEEGIWKTVAKEGWDALRAGQAYMSQLTTTFNPIFSLVNLKRDLSFAQRQMFIQHGARAALEWDKNFRPSLMACFSYMAMKADTFDVPDAIDEAVRRDASAIDEKEIERLANVTGKTKDEVRDLITKAEFNLFIENGGRIGYTSMINDTVAKKRYEKAFKRISEGKSERSLRGKAKDHVDEFAQAFENVSRFAAFKAILEGGSSPSAAAFAAHEVATNLSRRGTQTLFSGVKMFFNATTESLNQMVKNYKSNEKSLLPEQKEQVKTTIRQRQAIVTAANMAMTALAVMFTRGLAKALFGGDDDDEMPDIMSRVPEYRKNTELLIPYKVDEYGRVKAIRWHRPFQYRANSYAMTKFIEMFAGDTDFGEGMRDIIDAYVEEYLPVSGSPADRNSEGGLSLSISTFSPDVLKPFFEVAANKSRFGYPIRYTKEDGRSAWSKAKLGTDKTAMAISKALAGGKGTEYKSDAAINISPEVLEYLFKQYTGWIGQAYGWADNNIGMSKSERKRYAQKGPLSSRFFYDGTRDLGYDLVEDWANASEEAKIRAAAALSDDFREIYNVPKESREAMERAALETGYKSYLDMERAVKKLEQGYRRNVKFSQDPSLFPNERKRADEAAIKQLEGIMRLHYEFAKKYYEEIKK